MSLVTPKYGYFCNFVSIGPCYCYFLSTFLPPLPLVGFATILLTNDLKAAILDLDKNEWFVTVQS